MEIVLFRSWTRSDIDGAAYEQEFEHMMATVVAIPGFIDITAFAGEDGSELALVRFQSAEALAQWRDHVDHVRARQRGRDEFYQSYEITVATVSRRYDWSRSALSNSGKSSAPGS